ncbi:hypothetical protein E0H73_42955 [Kribbella pittospori]|uniref:Uncharacterized protein n=1 Tax=Kribbella pittospori TaxID=722689 RepID=A0A4R0JLJ7_9ACTN|nr:hypothetical protein [Kribbella pittospori]TCC48043.1 hypothetical protein E0H73_42955 [Kribbella pittospori]
MADKRQREIRAYKQITGLNYIRAAREMQRYANPTHREAASHAHDLVQRLEQILRADEADSAATVRALTLALDAARDVALQTDRGVVGWEEFDRAFQIGDWLREIGGQPSDVLLAADALVTCVCAARQRRCYIGHCRPTRCSPAPQRAQLICAGETKQGCFQHIAEEIVRLRESRSAMHYEITSPSGVAEAIEALVSSGAVAVAEDLEIDLGEATAHMVELELEYDLAQHTAQCQAAAITIAYGLGNDDDSTIRQVAAQVLEDDPSTCRCSSSPVD